MVREAGASPARTRHCDRGARRIRAVERRGHWAAARAGKAREGGPGSQETCLRPSPIRALAERGWLHARRGSSRPGRRSSSLAVAARRAGAGGDRPSACASKGQRRHAAASARVTADAPVTSGDSDRAPARQRWTAPLRSRRHRRRLGPRSAASALRARSSARAHTFADQRLLGAVDRRDGGYRAPRRASATTRAGRGRRGADARRRSPPTERRPRALRRSAERRAAAAVRAGRAVTVRSSYRRDIDGTATPAAARTVGGARSAAAASAATGADGTATLTFAQPARRAARRARPAIALDAGGERAERQRRRRAPTAPAPAARRTPARPPRRRAPDDRSPAPRPLRRPARGPPLRPGRARALLAGTRRGGPVRAPRACGSAPDRASTAALRGLRRPDASASGASRCGALGTFFAVGDRHAVVATCCRAGLAPGRYAWPRGGDRQAPATGARRTRVVIRVR